MIYRSSPAAAAPCPACGTPLTYFSSHGWATCEKGCGIWLGNGFAPRALPIANAVFSSRDWWKQQPDVPCPTCCNAMRDIEYGETHWMACLEHGHWLSNEVIAELHDRGLALDEKTLRTLSSANDDITSAELSIGDLLLRINELDRRLREEIAARIELQEHLVQLNVISRKTW